MGISENIRHRRHLLGLTLEEVAAKVGVNRQTMSRYETGTIKTIPYKRLELLATALDTTPAELAGWSPPAQLPAGAEPYNPTHKIPLLGKIAAGLPLYAEENLEGFVWTDRNHGGEYFALRVQGDSMNGAGIKDGDVIIIRQEAAVEDGEIAVVLVDGEATVKRYHQQGGTVILSPQSTNPTHQAQIYSLRDHDVTILGKVLESRTEIH